MKYQPIINEEEELDETQREIMNSSNRLTPDADADGQLSAERSELVKSDVVSPSQIMLNRNSRIR